MALILRRHARVTVRWRATITLCFLTISALIVSTLTFDVSSNAARSTRSKPKYVVPANSRQLIMAIADEWDSKHVILRRFSRVASGAWKQQGDEWTGRVGKNGLAWGRGLHLHDPLPPGVTDKVEGDGKAPAGVFDLGTIFGYAANVERNPNTEYVQVTDHDLLVDDPTSPLYNSYVHLDHAASTPWEIANMMNLNDPAHELKVFVKHNKDPQPLPGKGSAILLHIERPNENSFTVGCTAMPRQRMFDLVKWLDGDARPLYVLLPQQKYADVAKSWGLPLLGVAAVPTSATTSPPQPTQTIPVATTRVPKRKQK
jgi:L,D-peptidoglycan transpeptidase YkuD (ErfK/YbiS/YcfS/YnhG family)